MAHPPRNPNIDVIRTMAAWLIVLRHVVMHLEFRNDFYGGKVWWISHSLFTISAIAVPLFFLISGYLLADKKRTPHENLRHITNRLLIPFVAFTAIILSFENWLGAGFSWVNLRNSLWKGGDTHLYFLVSLMILYLITPVIQSLKKSLSTSLALMSVVFLFINTSMLLISGYVLNSLELMNSVFLYWFMALGYFYYGMIYKRIRKIFGQKQWFSSPGLLGVVLAASVLINAWLLMTSTHQYNIFNLFSGYEQSFFSILVILGSLLAFNWLMSLNLKKKLSHESKKTAEFLAKYSYGVYLCHMSVLEFLHLKTPITPNNPQITLVVYIISCFVVTLTVSYFISFVLANTRYLRIIVGEKPVVEVLKPGQ